MSDDTPWLSAEQLQAWLPFVAMLNQVPAALDAQLKREGGLNFFEYGILAGLSASAGRASQMATLANLSNGSQSRLSHAVSRLEKAGWVERRECEGVNRGVEAVLTPAGVAKLEECAPGHVREARRAVIDVLTPEELTVFRDACRKMVAAVNPAVLADIDAILRENHLD